MNGLFSSNQPLGEAVVPCTGCTQADSFGGKSTDAKGCLGYVGCVFHQSCPFIIYSWWQKDIAMPLTFRSMPRIVAR
jgi:hypothetical protein